MFRQTSREMYPPISQPLQHCYPSALSALKRTHQMRRHNRVDLLDALYSKQARRVLPSSSRESVQRALSSMSGRQEGFTANVQAGRPPTPHQSHPGIRFSHAPLLSQCCCLSLLLSAHGFYPFTQQMYSCHYWLCRSDVVPSRLSHTARTHTCRHTHIHTHVPKHTNTNIHSKTHTHGIKTHTHTHTRTQTHK